METAIGAACKTKCTDIVLNHEYKINGSRFEIDLLAADECEILIIETKAKMMTAKARTGNQLDLLDDFSKSFLNMVKQLARDEKHLREGIADCIQIADKIPSRNVLKIAVSPISFGPLSDKLFVTQLLKGVQQANFWTHSTDDKHLKQISNINESLSKALEQVVENIPIAPGSQPDIFDYLIDLFWVDLGQFIYLMGRGKSIGRAFAPIKNLTFGSRDLWTEIALADRQRISHGHWTTIQT